MNTLEERLQAVEDMLAVQQLMAFYHNAVDGWDERGTHKDPEAIAALFTEDGVWDVTAREPAPTGRAEVAQLAKDLQAVPWVIHTVVNPIVSPDGDEATGEFKGIQGGADSRSAAGVVDRTLSAASPANPGRMAHSFALLGADDQTVQIPPGLTQEGGGVRLS